MATSDAPGSDDQSGGEVKNQDDAVVADARPPSDPPADAAAAPAKGRRRSLVLLLAAAVVAVSGMVAWWLADADAALALAEERDVVLVEGRQAIEVMNTLDYRDVDAGIEAWQSVTTGTLADQLASVGADERQLLAEQEKISTGSVVDAAVLDLDDDTATVLASVEVAVVDDAEEDSPSSVKRNRFSADLVLVDGEWKLQSLQQVAVNL
ncbi:hypothetical protein ACHAAC_07990 [Aeromicrobium sp. CF4.19]|uniref:hypothetical protein n=1 Tax=Aeromicrobium sp. CF4.19 TaxID=3373082 RepID=UPI003EE73384